MPTFRAAIVGHSQVPTSLPGLPEGVEVELFRVSGAKARNFFSYPVFRNLLESRFDLIILWIGSNDIHDRCVVKDVARDIKAIVEQLEAVCTPKVKICLIEPRHPDNARHPHLDQETYNRIAKGINNNLQKRSLKGKGFITFSARPFTQTLARDGVHFNREGRAHIEEKLRNAIMHEHFSWPTHLWGFSDRRPREHSGTQ